MTKMPIRKTLKVIADLAKEGTISAYAVSGAVAASFYVEAVATEDVDIFVAVSDFPQKSGLIVAIPAEAALAKKGYTQRKDEGIIVEGWPVQIIPAPSPLEEEGVERAVEFTFGPKSAPVTTRVLAAEYVVAAALKTGRFKDHARIEQFLKLEKVDLRALKDVLVRHNLMEKWAEYCRRAGISDPLPVG